ncbi:MAG TPA: hypothetical protein VMU48_07765 [Terracidiphilus sp.]|nr:hypothetical protein [Terracidiphilus sp.]
MKIVCVFIMIGASLTAFGQSDLSKQTVAANPSFALTISCNPTNPNDEYTPEHVVVSADGMTLRIRKTNITDHTIMKRSHAGRAYGYDIDVRNSNGNLVGPRHPNEMMLRGGGKGGFRMSAKDMVLQPGESVINFVSLAGFNMGQPGDYTIQASAHISDDPKSPVVKSNIITVTVLPKAPDAEPK